MQIQTQQAKREENSTIRQSLLSGQWVQYSGQMLKDARQTGRAAALVQLMLDNSRQNQQFPIGLAINSFFSSCARTNIFETGATKTSNSLPEYMGDGHAPEPTKAIVGEREKT